MQRISHLPNTIARKNRDTFEKQRRELEKKLRADDKRKKRLARKVDATTRFEGTTLAEQSDVNE